MKLTISFPEHATRTGVTRSPASLAMTSVLPSLNKWQKWITARFYTKKINKPPQSKWFSTLQMAKDAQVYPRWTPIAAAMLTFKEREKLGRTLSESLSAIPGHTFDWIINERPFSPKFRENNLLGRPTAQPHFRSLYFPEISVPCDIYSLTSGRLDTRKRLH